MTPITLVAAGLLSPKKRTHPAATLNRYVNYGLIGLGSALQDAGYDACVMHGHHEAPDAVAERALRRHDPTLPLLLSIPSCHALPWAKAFCASLRSREPLVRIVVGGRWVTLDDAAWVRKHVPSDLVVFGEADDRIVNLVAPESWESIPGTDRTGAEWSRQPAEGYPILDYRIAEGYSDLTPSVEVSRGCGRHCAFCLEADASLWPLREIASLAAQIRKVQAAYSDEPQLRMYFECSSFIPTLDWAEALRAANLRVLWRTEARVDVVQPKLIPTLADAGLRILDLGLESADPQTLLRMNKTRNAEDYLSRADALLRACHANGVWAKINIVLYAGETRDSVARTMSWLEHRAHMIKGVSVGPLVVYRGPRKSHQAFLVDLAELGARPVRDNSLDEEGYADLHLSNELDRDTADDLTRTLSRHFMTHRDYFDLKSFGYFPRSLTFDAFESHLSLMPESEWPFRRA